jgi:hypothetical protein
MKNLNGQKKKVVLQNLATELGRTRKALEMRIYKETLNNPSVKKELSIRKRIVSQIVSQKEVKVNNNKNFKKPRKKFVWSKQSLEIIKIELYNAIKNNHSVEAFSKNLMRRFDISRSSVFFKIKTLREVTNGYTLDDMYNGLANGITVKDVKKKHSEQIFKNNQKAKQRKQEKNKKHNKQDVENILENKDKNYVVPTKTIKEEKQEVIDVKLKKPSLFQRLNPFYRIRQLEQQVKYLQSKKQ